MSDFKNTLFIILLPLTLTLTACSFGGKDKGCLLNSKGYCILYADNPQSKQWGEYLFKHLSNRTDNKNIVCLDNEREDCLSIWVKIDRSMPTDYCIENTETAIVLKTKTDKAMIWLLYQFMKQLSYEDNRFNGKDLPPAILDFNTICKDFDFEYREPFFNPNISGEYADIIGTYTLEDDWGIWGHNLSKVLGENVSDSVYAKQGAWIEKDQFCFSNYEIFDRLRTYINENFNNKSQRFMITPNDNNIVCLCNLCKPYGNTPQNTTPALSILLNRLSKEFPEHLFFSAAYLTTSYPPDSKWPENVGVMFSTINLPKGIELRHTKETEEFLTVLNRWKANTSKIYVWDYGANFDDYLTPIPILYGFQKQLQFYKHNGVEGVFLNASGYDYAPFDDLKTFVSAALMINVDLSVDSISREYFKQFYPVSGDILSDYYLSLEKRLDKNGKAYNMYGGFDEALRLYLNEEEFLTFYNALDSLLHVTEEEEKAKLKKLFTALSFTRLQLAHVRGIAPSGFADKKGKFLYLKPEIKKIYESLHHYENYEDLSRYKETGKIGVYIDNWKNIIEKGVSENLLLGENIEVLSKLDEEYKQTKMLNDGIPGFYADYHQGWFIISDDNLDVRFKTDSILNTKSISLRFLVDEKHHIYSPEKVEIYKDGQLYKDVKAKEKNNEGTRIAATIIPVNFSGANTITVKIYRNKKNKGSIACDEIRLN